MGIIDGGGYGGSDGYYVGGRTMSDSLEGFYKEKVRDLTRKYYLADALRQEYEKHHADMVRVMSMAIHSAPHECKTEEWYTKAHAMVNENFPEHAYSQAKDYADQQHLIDAIKTGKKQ